MNIIKRIKNLWKISALPINIEQISKNLDEVEKGSHRMAQIIKMKDEEKIISEILTEEK